MGDNRLYSEDSRMRREDPGGGTIPESAVIGRAFLIVWPLSRWRVLPIPATFAQPGVRPSQVPRVHAAGSLPASAIAVATPSPPYLPLGAGLAGASPGCSAACGLAAVAAARHDRWPGPLAPLAAGYPVRW
jgi:hypothetical protein